MKMRRKHGSEVDSWSGSWSTLKTELKARMISKSARQREGTHPNRQPAARNPAPQHPLRASSRVPSFGLVNNVIPTLNRTVPSESGFENWTCASILTVCRVMPSLRVKCDVKFIQRLQRFLGR